MTRVVLGYCTLTSHASWNCKWSASQDRQWLTNRPGLCGVINEFPRAHNNKPPIDDDARRIRSHSIAFVRIHSVARYREIRCSGGDAACHDPRNHARSRTIDIERATSLRVQLENCPNIRKGISQSDDGEGAVRMFSLFYSRAKEHSLWWSASSLLAAAKILCSDHWYVTSSRISLFRKKRCTSFRDEGSAVSTRRETGG